MLAFTDSKTISDGKYLALGGTPQAKDITLEISGPLNGTLRLEVFGEPIIVDFGAKAIKVCNVGPAPFALEGDALRLRVLVDRGSLEVFVGEGTTAISTKATPQADAHTLKIEPHGSTLTVKSTLLSADQ